MRYAIMFLSDSDEWVALGTELEGGKPMSFDTEHDAKLAVTVLQYAWNTYGFAASRFRIVNAVFAEELKIKLVEAKRG